MFVLWNNIFIYCIIHVGEGRLAKLWYCMIDGSVELQNFINSGIPLLSIWNAPISQSETTCNLNRDCEPTVDKYKDYKFCKKSLSKLLKIVSRIRNYLQNLNFLWIAILVGAQIQGVGNMKMVDLNATLKTSLFIPGWLWQKT